MTTIEEAKRISADAMLKKHIEKTGNIAQTNLTVRDYFATKAMQGICAAGPSFDWTDQRIAIDAYKLADAMLTERNKNA